MRRNLSHMSVVAGAAMLAMVGVTASPTLQEQAKKPQQPQAAASRAKVDLDELEDNPGKFIGKNVSVDGEVDRVLGPHLFTIDEANWADPEREMPVFVPEPFAAIVSSDTPVRVTGTVQKVPIAKIEAQRAFLDKDPKIRAEIEAQPVLVATEVTATTPAGVTLRVRPDQPVGTSGASGEAPVTDAGEVARANDKKLVGRRVDLKNAPVAAVSDDGFWIRLPDGERIFVMPAKKTAAREGQTADIQGVVLELPEGLRVSVNAADEPVYIYAERVTAR